jgi:hypothetical protein
MAGEAEFLLMEAFLSGRHLHQEGRAVVLELGDVHRL